MPQTAATLTDSPDLVSEALLDLLLREHRQAAVPRYDRLWRYYRNALGGDGQPGPGQLEGLPGRLTSPADPQRAVELVIENDIAWRVHALVDFMFGRAASIQSLAASPARAAAIERYLGQVFDEAGGLGFFQSLALLGAVYGFADILVRADAAGEQPVRLELVEAPRAIPLLNTGDYRQLDAYIIHCLQQTHDIVQPGVLGRIRQRVRSAAGEAAGERAVIERTELWTPSRHELYLADPRQRSGRRIGWCGANLLGRVPVVHIQNLAQPFFYEGLSEVEPLIPLQDELNTRLSDRANRVTFQSFKMYLGKCIEKFTDRPVGPGQMWATDNPAASIEAFGGDAASPSEEAHINEIREALDKTSGVSPVAAGVVRDRVGNLTSENALRIVMLGLLAKTQKKRTTYGHGLRQLAELILHAADVTGAFPNEPGERRVRIDWPDPMPDTETQRLANARLKLEIGVPAKQVLAELGYAEGEVAGNRPPRPNADGDSGDAA